MNKMQTLLTTTVLLFGISGSGVADLNDAFIAYDKGDYKTTLDELRPLAEQGDAKAQFYLGVMYTLGSGVLKDDKEAVKWYRKAAEQGLADAQYNLSVSYGRGIGVTQDLSKAKYWIQKAYKNPNTSANTRELAEKDWSIFELWKY